MRKKKAYKFLFTEDYFWVLFERREIALRYFCSINLSDDDYERFNKALRERDTFEVGGFLDKAVESVKEVKHRLELEVRMDAMHLAGVAEKIKKYGGRCPNCGGDSFSDEVMTGKLGYIMCDECGWEYRQF